jgi:LysM repeat protein
MICMFVVMTIMNVVNVPTVYAESPTIHVVAWGETLYSIARIYGVAPQTLASVNGISINNWVYAGQQLAIPSHSSRVDPARSLSPSGYYTVRAGDTLFSIASRFGIGTEALAAMNDLPSAGLIYVGWALKVPSASSPGSQSLPKTSTRVHIVQLGEYLNRIALEYGTTAQAIMLSNNLPIEWLIYPGQRLIIPTPGESSASPIPAAATMDIRIPNVPLYRQQQTLTCEQASVAMATRGAVSEARLVAAMARSDNPFLGIRGKTNSPYYGGLTDYGSYAPAIQKGLNALGIRSQVLYGQDYDDFKEALLAHLRANRPVVWWHTWHDTYQVPVIMKTSDGATVKLVPYEHAGVIVGANQRGMTYNDPYDASVRFVSWADHRRVSGYFNNMALVVYQ